MRKYVATVYMGPVTYYFMTVGAENIVEATQVAVGDCADANPFWRVIRISEMTREADNAPIFVEGD